MQTLDAPVYEIKKDSRWYQGKLKEEIERSKGEGVYKGALKWKM